MTAPALPGGRSRRRVSLTVIDAATIVVVALTMIAAGYIAGWHYGTPDQIVAVPAPALTARQTVDAAAAACLVNRAYGTSRPMFAQCLDDYEGMVAAAAGPLTTPPAIMQAINGHGKPGCSTAWLELDPGTGDMQWYCR